MIQQMAGASYPYLQMTTGAEQEIAVLRSAKTVVRSSYITAATIRPLQHVRACFRSTLVFNA
jgi:hypothetical protein